MRTSRKVYNQSLVASIITRLGEKQTKKVVEGWVANLAKPVFTSDSQLLEAIDKGYCQVGIANTYYLVKLIEDKKVKNVDVFWPTKANGGVHVNLSGAGIVKTSKNKREALKLMQWLVTTKAQEMFAGVNYEYPVVENVEQVKLLKQWGPFDRETTELGNLAPFQKKAVFLMDSAKYL